MRINYIYYHRLPSTSYVCFFCLGTEWTRGPTSAHMTTQSPSQCLIPSAAVTGPETGTWSKHRQSETSPGFFLCIREGRFLIWRIDLERRDSGLLITMFLVMLATSGRKDRNWRWERGRDREQVLASVAFLYCCPQFSELPWDPSDPLTNPFFFFPYPYLVASYNKKSPHKHSIKGLSWSGPHPPYLVSCSYFKHYVPWHRNTWSFLQALCSSSPSHLLTLFPVPGTCFLHTVAQSSSHSLTSPRGSCSTQPQLLSSINTWHWTSLFIDHEHSYIT